MMRRIWRSGRLDAAAAIAAAVLTCLAGVALSGRANAQGEGAGGGLSANFLNPFPENDAWRGLVVGDYLAEGLLVGMLDAMASENRLQLQRKHRPMTTLARETDDDIKALEDVVTKEKIHIVVMMLGMADRGGIRLANGRRLAVGQGDWRTQYSSRADRIVRMLRRKGVAVYWVGLPIMRRSDWSEDVESINEVIRERALSSNARYIDAYKESADENGQFSDRGPDIAGKVVRLRDPDGYDFTPAGYRKLAFFIERQMKRDMSAAREERAIPLAGSDIEQKRINPEAARIAGPATEAAAAGTTAAGATAAAAANRAKDARAAASPAARAIIQGGAATSAPASELTQQGDLKADNVKVSFKSAIAGGKEEQVTVEIVRPALTASVIQLMTRRDKGDRPSQVGDTITDTLSNGLLVMRSVTATRSGSGDRATSRATLTQQPFFIALARGERLPSKPGRADDFRWPREDDLPPPPTAATAKAAPITSPVPLTQPVKGRPRRSSGGQ